MIFLAVYLNFRRVRIALGALFVKTKFRSAEENSAAAAEIFSRKFRNLKNSLINHLESNCHKSECAKQLAVKALKEKDDSRISAISWFLALSAT